MSIYSSLDHVCRIIHLRDPVACAYQFYISNLDFGFSQNSSANGYMLINGVIPRRTNDLPHIRTTLGPIWTKEDRSIFDVIRPQKLPN